MRELDAGELMLVDGGVAPLVAVAVAGAVAGAVLGAAAIGVVAYAASKGCSASAEMGESGVKVQVDCKKN